MIHYRISWRVLACSKNLVSVCLSISLFAHVDKSKPLPRIWVIFFNKVGPHHGYVLLTDGLDLQIYCQSANYLCPFFI